jgi:RimJ/RimL family protein N-acetyltransferase
VAVGHDVVGLLRDGNVVLVADRAVLEPKSAGTAPGRPHLLPGNLPHPVFCECCVTGTAPAEHRRLGARFGPCLNGRKVASCARIVGRVMPSLKTERLLLRPLRTADLGALAALHTEQSFWQYPLGRGQTHEEASEFLRQVLDEYEQHGFGLAAVVHHGSSELAGWAGLSIPAFLPEILPAVEVGWRLGLAWRGQGFATEAGAAWVEWGFESLGLDRIVSIFEPANVASGRVMKKLGFELELVTAYPNRNIALHVTALTKGRWSGLRGAGKWPATTDVDGRRP